MLPKFSDFVNSYVRKKTSKSIRLQLVFIKQKFEVNKKQIFSSEEMKIQVIVFMILFTRSSERIFNSMRYTGIYFCFEKLNKYFIYFEKLNLKNWN